MNIQDNAQIARDAYQKFGEGDLDGLMNYYTDDVVFDFPGPPDLIPIAGSFRGKDQVRQFFYKVKENLQFTSFEPLEFVVHEDKVIVLGRDAGQTLPTGISFDEEWVHISTFRGDKISHWQAFVDTARAVADFHPEKAYSA